MKDEKYREDKMDNILKVLKVTKRKNSHVSIYVFERTDEEIKGFKARLPKKFYIEKYPGEDYMAFRADNFAGFEYVEITVYPKEEQE